MNNIGLIGLAQMGSNLSKNFANNNVKIAVYNRSKEKTDDLLSENIKNIEGFYEIEDFVKNIEKPRNIILMVKSGKPVDKVIDTLKPLLDKGDTIIDFGNSFWKDTLKRHEEMESEGFHFVGSGVSGGWKGALEGPSIMPGGDKNAMDNLLPLLERVSAKDFSGKPCTTNVGKGASGHFVKMVHNGIEYSIMQLIAEIYDLLKNKGFSNSQIAEIFSKVNEGKNESYLLEITINILKYKLDSDKYELLEYIQPIANAKGTGLWTVQTALEIGFPCSILFAGVNARLTSHFKSNFKIDSNSELDRDLTEISDDLFKVFNSAASLCFIEGLELIKAISNKYSWEIDLIEVMRIWQGGCIIRSKILTDLMQNPDFENLEYLRYCLEYVSIFDKYHANSPSPVINSIKDYLRSRLSSSLPQNITQAQRDYFGAHTFTRIDNGQISTDQWNQ